VPSAECRVPSAECRVPSAECRVPSLRIWLLALVCLWSMLLGVRSEAFALAPPAAVKNLAAWYDASDASTLTATTSYTGVSQWTDKSGNGETLTSLGEAQPTYVSSGINGLGSMQFSGGQYFLSNDTNFSRFLLPTSTVFLVQNVSNGSQASYSISSNVTYASNNYDLSLPYYGSSDSDVLCFGDCSSNQVKVAASAANPVGSHIWMVNGSEGGSYTWNDDGTSIATGTLPTTGEVSSCPLAIGAYAQKCGTALGSFFKGMIGEVIVYNTALSQTNEQEVEGILACKWGLQSQLPAGHPWKSSCPSGTESTNLSSISGLSAWYDASDASTVTTTTSSLVSQWNDKSGQGETLANAGSSLPTYLASGINGLGTLQFSGQYLQSNDTNFSRLFFPSSTTFIVESYNPNQYGIDLWSQNSQQYWTGFYNCRDWTFGYEASTTYICGLSSGTGMYTFWGSVPVTTAWMSLDGGVQTASISPTSYGTSSCRLFVGIAGTCTTATGPSFLGNIAEILIYTTGLSKTEYQFIEGYLACKWGLQSTLPSSHPYKSTCPATATPNLTLVASVSPTGNQPPGTVLTYTTTYTNSSGTIAYNPTFSAAIPAHTDFQVGSLTSNAGNTGLSYAATYSNDGGTTWTYTPTSGAGGAASGYDRSVTNVRWALSGALAPGTGVNSGTVGFVLKIQ